jgi:putative ATP-binding cassette transporter
LSPAASLASSPKYHLDEATAALEAPGQNRLTELLFQELKDATIVRVGHRLELAAFHQRKI